MGKKESIVLFDDTGEQQSHDQPLELQQLEQESVRTTIVGGRPPGSGKPMGGVLRGIEVLLKKAAIREISMGSGIRHGRRAGVLFAYPTVAVRRRS